MTRPVQSATLDAARTYIAFGWPVFVLSASKMPVRNCDPCRFGHNTPQEMEACTCLTCHGFYAATLDIGRVAEMVRQHPRGLLAIRTGAPSGLVVVDVDPRHGGLESLLALEVARGLPLSRDPVQVTGGGGVHIVYRHPGGHVQGGEGKLGAGIDVKSDGGYIVVSPSRHPQTGRPYLWMSLARLPPPLPDDVRAALYRPPARLVGPMRPRFVRPSGAATGRWAGILAKLVDAREGERNKILYWSALRAREMITAGELTEREAAAALHDAAHRIGLTDTAIRDTVRSGAGVEL